MKRLLITGAYGLVGSNICKVLARDYHNIEVIKTKYNGFSNQYNWKENFDFIIHAAGYGQPVKFSEYNIDTIKTNTLGILELMEMLKPDGKFIFISSSEIYSGAKSPYKETDIGTTTPQHPRACYIEGKRCGEAICMAYREQGYDVKIARLSLGYGPGTKKGDTRVLHSFIEQSITRDIILKDDGEAVRTYCYISDAVEMLFNILFKGTQDVYNVGGESEITIKELALMIARKQGCGIVLGKVNKPIIGAPDNVKLDITRYENEFGKKKFVSLSEGLDKTIEWQKSL